MHGLLFLLKESLTSFDKRYHRKVAFFNEWSFYRHIRSYSVEASTKPGSTVGTILDVLEPYIPFKLSEENFDLFMEAVFAPDLDPQFTHKAKMDFVMTVRGIRHPSEWEQTLAVCEGIRALKEDLEDPKSQIEVTI